MTKPLLLVDGDGVAYRAAFANQKTVDWGDGDSDTVLDQDGAEDSISSALSFYKRELNAGEMIVCIRNDRNWRKELWADYKAHRKELEKPLLLDHCYRFLAERYRTVSWPRLEADDILGILAYEHSNAIIVSIDKDMQSVPCRLYNPNKPDLGVRLIGPVEAFRNHMIQTLTGDTADGYKGVPRVGPVKAAKIIDPLLPDLDYPGSVADALLDFKQAKEDIWNAVVETFETHGLASEDALMNARLSYILQNPKEYNRETAKVRLWRPPT